MSRIGGSITRVWSHTFMQIIKKKDYFKKLNIFYLEEFQIQFSTQFRTGYTSESVVIYMNASDCIS